MTQSAEHFTLDPVSDLISDFISEGEQRLDVLVAGRLGVTRSFAQKLIRGGHVTRSPSPSSPSSRAPQTKLKPSQKIPSGTALSVSVPPPEALEIEPEDVPFGVVYEDEHLLVVDKPAGLVVHPAPGHWRGTLVHGLLFRYPDVGAFDVNNAARPGIVHRLDATTSGLMLVARGQNTMAALQSAFKDRTVEKKYLALAHGNFERLSGTLEGPIGRHPRDRLKMAVVEDGRPSATGYRVLWNRPGLCLVICNLLTGRTHQIRVHMAAAGHPLIGDALYGAQEAQGFGRVFLHSWKLSFAHPATGQPMSFTSPLPRELREYLARLARLK